MSSIRVHIEQLVLDGFTLTPAERAQLQAALVAELTRLLAAGGLPTHLAGARPQAGSATDGMAGARPQAGSATDGMAGAGQSFSTNSHGKAGATPALTTPVPPQQLGREIARAVYGGTPS